MRQDPGDQVDDLEHRHRIGEVTVEFVSSDGLAELTVYCAGCGAAAHVHLEASDVTAEWAP